MTATVAETATLAWGYTMADLDRLSRMAHRYGGTSNDIDEQLNAAWVGIVERLYTSEQHPSRSELITAGKFAIMSWRDSYLKMHGFSRKTSKRTPNHVTYWRSGAGRARAEDFTDGLVERLALPQILGSLTVKQYEAVVALAAYGQRAPAADALGLTLPAFDSRIEKARRRINALWFEPDTPRPTWTKARINEVCRYGHSREHSYKDANDLWVCNVCKRNDSRRRRARLGRGAAAGHLPVE